MDMAGYGWEYLLRLCWSLVLKSKAKSEKPQAIFQQRYFTTSGLTQMPFLSGQIVGKFK